MGTLTDHNDQAYANEDPIERKKREDYIRRCQVEIEVCEVYRAICDEKREAWIEAMELEKNLP